MSAEYEGVPGHVTTKQSMRMTRPINQYLSHGFRRIQRAGSCGALRECCLSVVLRSMGSANWRPLRDSDQKKRPQHNRCLLGAKAIRHVVVSCGQRVRPEADSPPAEFLSSRFHKYGRGFQPIEIASLRSQ